MTPPTRPQWRTLARAYTRNVQGLVAPRRGMHRYAASASRHLQRHGWLSWHAQRQGWVLSRAGFEALTTGDSLFGAWREPVQRELSASHAKLIAQVRLLSHPGQFFCACGERFEDADSYGQHFRLHSYGLQPMEVWAVIQRHTVKITCRCGVKFESPFRFHLHQQDRLRALDLRADPHRAFNEEGPL